MESFQSLMVPSVSTSPCMSDAPVPSSPSLPFAGLTPVSPFHFHFLLCFAILPSNGNFGSETQINAAIISPAKYHPTLPRELVPYNCQCLGVMTRNILLQEQDTCLALPGGWFSSLS